MRRRCSLLALLAAAGMAVSVVPADPQSITEPAASEELPSPSIVEDFSYPNAKEILETKGIELISGDSKITLADCDNTQNLIKAETLKTPGPPKYCFNVDGDKGYLRLRLENVFLVWAGDEKLRATVSVDGVEQPPVDIEPGKTNPVGASDPEDFAVLLELRAGM